MRLRRFVLASLAGGLAVVLAGFPSATHALSIVSGSSWLATATDPGGLAWTEPGFDDSSWIPAYAPYPPGRNDEGNYIPGTSALWMWYWTDPTPPTGSDGPLETWYRYDFSLSASDFPADGHAKVVGDDYFALYVNGHFVGDGFHDVCFCAYSEDFTPWLVVGDNVLAIYAFDGFHTGPADRFAESVLFDAAGAVVPEPASLALLGSGVLGLALRRRRARSRWY